MLMKLFGPLKPFTNWGKQKTENWVFKLHCKTTVLFILTCSILVTASTFIGDPIDCIVHQDVPQAVMDTYCWIHSTFTLPKRITESNPEDSATAHPGVGNQHPGEEQTNLKYYQWVCFTLFFQAILFYVPKWIWKNWEGGRMKDLVPNELVYSVTDIRMPMFPLPKGMLEEDMVNDRVTYMKDFFLRHCGMKGRDSFRLYFVRFVFCEFLNLINVVGQIFFINMFLGGMFTTYGSDVVRISQMDPEDRYDPMNLVFPKVAKCTFHRSGPSGTIEVFDGLCVLPVNIINEKIYIFLWYWLVILSIITAIYLSYRIITIASRGARKATLKMKSHNLADDMLLDRITKSVTVGDWFFLCQVGSNIDPHIFQQLLDEIDEALLTKQKIPNGKLADKIA